MGQLFFDMRRLMWPSGPVIRLSKGTLTSADSTEREATDFDSERFRERVRVAARDTEPWDRDPPATEVVYVRFTSADLDTIKDEAERRDVSVAQLLRENTLRDLRAEAS